jgi:hypothetical protein
MAAHWLNNIAKKYNVWKYLPQKQNQWECVVIKSEDWK